MYSCIVHFLQLIILALNLTYRYIRCGKGKGVEVMKQYWLFAVPPNTVQVDSLPLELKENVASIVSCSATESSWSNSSMTFAISSNRASLSLQCVSQSCDNKFIEGNCGIIGVSVVHCRVHHLEFMVEYHIIVRVY